MREVQSQRGGRRAAVDFLDLEIRDRRAPELSVRTRCPSSVEAVTPIVPALLIAWTTSSMFWAVGEVDHGAGAAAVGDADFAGREAFSAVDVGRG